MTYELTSTTSVRRASDGALIPPEPTLGAWQEYQEWLAAGNVPTPYTPPVVDWRSPLLTDFRTRRELVLNRLAGIAARAVRAGDSTGLAAACDAAAQALLDMTKTPAVVAATDAAGLKAALAQTYAALLASAPVALRRAFGEVDQ